MNMHTLYSVAACADLRRGTGGTCPPDKDLEGGTGGTGALKITGKGEGHNVVLFIYSHFFLAPSALVNIYFRSTI